MATALRNPARLVFRNINAVRPETLQIFDNNNREVDLYDINNYVLNTVNSTPRNTLENFESGSADIGRTITFLSFPASWQLGAQQRTQTRDMRRQNQNWTFNGINGDRSPAPFLTPVYFGQYNYYGFRGVPEISPIRAWSAYQANPALFSKTAAQVVTEEAFRINNSLYFEEGVRSYYGQTEFSLFKYRLKVLTGVRYEQTRTKGLGPLVDSGAAFVKNADGTFAHNAAGARVRRADAGAAGSLEELKLTTRERASRADRTYDGYYPSLHLNYNFTENIIGRVAYAKTYGRPNLTSVLPTAQISEADLDAGELGDPSVVKGNITVTNTGLRPWSADNFDLSLEYYTKNGGVISGGAFVKDLKSFFVNSVSIATAADAAALGLDPRYAGWRITTTRNGGSARVSGVEFNVRQSLRELGAWGRNVNVFVNGTKLHLEGDNEADFNAFTPEGLNWGFSYSPRRATFMAKWNYRGKRRLGSLAGGAYEYDDRRLMLDLNFDYQMSKRLQFYASAQNVFNQRSVTMRYGPATPDYAKNYLTGAFGVGLTIGLKGAY
jgi:TonB-dependent receptor